MRTIIAATIIACFGMPVIADTPRIDRLEGRVDAYRAQPVDDRIDARLLERAVRVDARLGRDRATAEVTDRLERRADRIDARIANVPCMTDRGAAVCEGIAAGVDRRIDIRRAFRDRRFD